MRDEAGLQPAHLAEVEVGNIPTYIQDAPVAAVGGTAGEQGRWELMEMDVSSPQEILDAGDDDILVLGMHSHILN